MGSNAVHSISVVSTSRKRWWAKAGIVSSKLHPSHARLTIHQFGHARSQPPLTQSMTDCRAHNFWLYIVLKLATPCRFLFLNLRQLSFWKTGWWNPGTRAGRQRQDKRCWLSTVLTAETVHNRSVCNTKKNCQESFSKSVRRTSCRNASKGRLSGSYNMTCDATCAAQLRRDSVMTNSYKVLLGDSIQDMDAMSLESFSFTKYAQLPLTKCYRWQLRC
jgi:hypothetical protein